MLVEVVQAVVTGLLIGLTFAVLAVGFSLIWGTTGVVNIAHSAFAVLAAFLSLVASRQWGLDPIAALVGLVPLFFILGVVLHEVLIKVAARRTKELGLASMIFTFGLASFMENGMAYVWGPGPRVLNTAYTGAAVHLLGISIPLTHAYGALLGLATIGLLYGFLYHTFPGKAVRAVWQQRDGAALCGIPLHRVTALTYGVSIASASVAGVAMALIYSFTPATYMVWLVNVFLIVIVGGVGSLLGAAAAGLIVGLVSSLSVLVMPFVWTNLALFGLLILVLLVRPSGLLKR
ncbi:MAG TPA: branched-chain amino acid ABC transporter permease [Limnochordales bacterium]|nr:branched-chain amino acid ABC transporter permease [Limnochordales bacterium]